MTPPMATCPVCGREVPSSGRVPFHYECTSWAPDALRVCSAVDVRTDDHRTIAALQQARATLVALEWLTAMVAEAAPTLERVAVAIEARTAVAKAAEARAAKSAAEYLDALMRATSDDDSGPVPAPVDDSADDGSH